ncbi:MAG: hypothetical protein PHC66_03660 [Candidatus Nanoarchaeia archaeon]|nr:hypothetical protein [Candidatus Nanoarchaeia archaeon]MDD5238956.1 hypothetical protein [Candidatus Nanoarchaeia archaeon]
MKPITGHSLNIHNFNAWVLSKALIADKQKYEEGMHLFKKAKEKKYRSHSTRFYIFYFTDLIPGLTDYLNERALQSGAEAASKFEEALDRKIDLHPYNELHQVFLLTEDYLRKKGFTTNYKFKTPAMMPYDSKLEADLEYLEGMQSYCGPIATMQNEKSIAADYRLELRKGRCKAGEGFWIFQFNQEHLFYYPLVFVEKTYYTQSKLQKKLGASLDDLAEKINYWGYLAVNDPAKLSSLVKSSRLGKECYNLSENT